MLPNLTNQYISYSMALFSANEIRTFFFGFGENCIVLLSTEIVLKERAEIVVVRRFLTYECRCGPHCAVRTALHTTVRVVLKPMQ